MPTRKGPDGRRAHLVPVGGRPARRPGAREAAPSSPPGGAPPRRLWAGRPFPVRVVNAARGVWLAYRTEPNLRFHVFAATAALALAHVTATGGWRLAYLLASVSLVLAAELANTAVERAVDLASRQQPDPVARAAKDVAAGVVLVATVHALAAGWLVFVEPVGPVGLLRLVLGYSTAHPVPAAFLGALVALTGAVGLLAGKGQG
ncbi:diacylglycerol kinase family protein [Caldinitratiruptor microaerophilus]|uniref:Diacylglycerol kinase n=1 Tax=Caldinitratiruptor microaerophilus TaxID=671077 RepID=A0AA35CPJ1_9FIRM|nr:diacylglycerol kinase family protein [Caldinitratiruptor microaerophilus]BDG61405.1 hypothetical protein caldi_24950 [Caldinitratiruptor microaerophilus]